MENTKKRKKGKQIIALLLAALLTFQNVEIGAANVVDGDNSIEATVEVAEELEIVQIEETDTELEKETDDSDEIDKKEWQEEQETTAEEMELFLDESIEVQEEDGIVKAASSGEVISSGSCGKNVTYILDSEGVLTISGSGDMVFHAASTRHGLDIKKIIIEDGVTNIGISAFYGCSNLTSVEIPSSVTYIECQVFYGCSSLTSVKIPSSVETIAHHVFYGCSSLTSVEIPSNVKSIGYNAFDDCSELSTIKILNSECDIWDSMYTIPEDTIIYGYTNSTAQSYAEKYNRTFVSLSILPEIPDNNNIISDFKIDTSKTVTLNSTITISGTLTLSDNTEISSDIFQKEVANIRWTSSDSSIAEVTDCTGINSIYNHSTYLIITVTPKKEGTVTITGVTSNGMTASCEMIIRNSVEGKCGDNLTWVLYREGEDKNVLTISGIGDMWNFDNDKNCTPWVDYIDEIQIIKIESGVTSIGSYAFSHCKNVCSIDIAETVLTIGAYSFEYCKNLSNFGNSWKPIESAVINEGAFYCSGLESVTFPNGLESIGDEAFYNCIQLIGGNARVNLIIPESVKSIGRGVFGNLSNLNILFDGDVPIFNDETFFKTSVCVYYYLNDTWTDEVRKDYGGEVTWIQRYDWSDNSYFVLREDTNKWSHTPKSFFNDEEEVIGTSLEYELKLALYATDSLKDAFSYLVNDRKWQGVCYGLTVSEIAKYFNYYDDAYWGQSVENFYGFDQPKDNISLRNMISYFHLAQDLPIGSYTKKITTNTWGIFYKSFWDSLMEETKKSSALKIPIMLSYYEKGGGGHAVIICGYDDYSFDNMFLFKIYDINSASSQYETLFLNTDDYTFSFQDANARNVTGKDISNIWEQIQYYDSDRIIKLLNTIGEKQNAQLEMQTLVGDSPSSDIEYTDFIAEYGKDFVLTNKKGEELIYSGDGLNYEASMEVNDTTITGDGNEKKIIFRIGYSSNFELTNFSDGLFGIQMGNILYSLDCTNVTKLSFDSAEGIKFQGENSSYIVYVINGNEIVDERRVTHSVEGNSSGEVTISYVENSLVLNSENEIKDINGSVYYGRENTDAVITTDVDGNYIIKDSSTQDPDKPSDKEKEYVISYNLSGGTLNENTNPSKYTSMTETFALNNPTREGYTFVGWTGSNGSVPQKTVIIEKGSTGNLSYTANWKQNTSSEDNSDNSKEEYIILYDLDGGSFNTSGNPKSYTVDTETFILNNPIKEGYIFIGWTGSNGTTPQKNVTIEKGTTGNLSYTANWKRNTSSNNGSNSNNNSSSDDSDDDNNFLPINTTNSFSGKWIQDKIGWWYKNADSSYPANKWQFINGKWYFFDKAGYMTTGWILSNNKWYYLDTNGAMLENSWVFYKNHWYFLKGGNGDMATGWILWKNQWYYLNQDGSMKTGWLFDRNIWYYLNKNGDMAVNSTTPDGYQVDSNGAWISED